MINHARTILLNVSGENNIPSDFYCEEYIPETFRPTRLPRLFQNIWNILYDPQPDRYFLNFMTRRYMSILHSTEFRSYILRLDNRITYDMSRMVLKTNQGTIITPMYGAPDAYTVSAPLSRNRMNGNWSIRALTDSVEVVDNIKRLAQVYPVAIVDGRVNIPIIDDFSLIIVTTTWENYWQWNVSTFYPPQKTLVSVVEQLSDLPLADLFANTRNYPEFKNLWDYHNLIPYKLSGLLLSYIYNLNEGVI